MGDNAERRQSIEFYRIPEPQVNQTVRITARAEVLHVRYPDRPHDAEALYVEPDGGLVIVTKGRTGGVLVFRVPASAWRTRATIVASYLDRLPIAANLARGRVVTDAGISPDGRTVAVRTYREIFFFSRDRTGRLRLEPGRPVCDIGGLEPQGEGLDWWNENTLVLTSERGRQGAGTITLVRCPSR